MNAERDAVRMLYQSMDEASANDEDGKSKLTRFCLYVLSHRQFAVENNTEVSNGINWLNSNRAEIEAHDVELPWLHQVGSGAEPDQFGLVRV